MKIIIDNKELAAKYFDIHTNWLALPKTNNGLMTLTKELYNHDKLYVGQYNIGKWNNLLIVENAPMSQYDVLIDLMHAAEIPDLTLCAAVSGSKFHGFRGRSWVSLPGNIHLSVFLNPNKTIENLAGGFILLSAVSVLQVIDDIEALNGLAGIKWVNDILINDAKVCGVLAHTQAQGSKVTGAVLGIGLNVESAPDVESNPFIPKASCINEFLPPDNRTSCGIVFHSLINKLLDNYELLLDGGYRELLQIYKKRSVAIGKKVYILSDPPAGKSELLMKGTVKAIGDNMELIFDDSDITINKGRMIIQE